MITVRRGACISETYNSSLAFGTLYFLRILQQQVFYVAL